MHPQARTLVEMATKAKLATCFCFFFLKRQPRGQSTKTLLLYSLGIEADGAQHSMDSSVCCTESPGIVTSLWWTSQHMELRCLFRLLPTQKCLLLILLPCWYIRRFCFRYLWNFINMQCPEVTIHLYLKFFIEIWKGMEKNGSISTDLQWTIMTPTT